MRIEVIPLHQDDIGGRGLAEGVDLKVKLTFMNPRQIAAAAAADSPINAHRDNIAFNKIGTFLAEHPRDDPNIFYSTDLSTIDINAPEDDQIILTIKSSYISQLLDFKELSCGLRLLMDQKIINMNQATEVYKQFARKRVDLDREYLVDVLHGRQNDGDLRNAVGDALEENASHMEPDAAVVALTSDEGNQAYYRRFLEELNPPQAHHNPNDAP
jgi:hypothetical protein